jgi:hypothetical protein
MNNDKIMAVTCNAAVNIFTPENNDMKIFPYKYQLILLQFYHKKIDKKTAHPNIFKTTNL